jgi:hypothetical protein
MRRRTSNTGGIHRSEDRGSSVKALPKGRCSGRTPGSLRSLVRPPEDGRIVSQTMLVPPARVKRSTSAVLAWVSLCAAVGVATLHRTQSAMTELRSAPSLSLDGLGGVTREAMGFQWLLRVPGTERRFSSLVDEGSPAARVFGACGLYLTQSARFEAARDRLLADANEVEMGGCILLSSRVREVAADLPRFCRRAKLSGFEWAVTEAGWLLGR